MPARYSLLVARVKRSQNGPWNASWIESQPAEAGTGSGGISAALKVRDEKDDPPLVVGIPAQQQPDTSGSWQSPGCVLVSICSVLGAPAVAIRRGRLFPCRSYG